MKSCLIRLLTETESIFSFFVVVVLFFNQKTKMNYLALVTTLGTIQIKSELG